MQAPSPTLRVRRWLSPAIESFDLDPGFFPEATKTLFPLELIIKNGMLPLGYKSIVRFFRAEKRLNVGFLTPSLSLDAAKAAIQGKFESQAQMSIQPYQIQASQLLAVLHQVFGISSAQVVAFAPTEVHPDLLKAALETS